MFFCKGSSEILSLLWNKFQENIHLYLGFSEYSSTEELLKSLEEYNFNKCYNHDTVDLVFEALSKIFEHRVFIFEESLKNSPRGIVGEKYRRCINVLKRGDHYNLIVQNEKGCEKVNNRLHNPYSRATLLFYIFFCFIFPTALLKGYTKVCNHPKPSTTTHKHPQSATTIHNHPKTQKSQSLSHSCYFT